MTDTNKEADLLKPCPFCGGKPHLLKDYSEYDRGTYYSYRCKGCGAETRKLYARETCPVFYGQLRDIWNDQRGLADQLQAARDLALEEAALRCDEAHQYHSDARAAQIALGNDDAAQDRMARMTTCRTLGCDIRALKSGAEG